MDEISGNTASLLGGATYALGKVGNAFDLDGLDDVISLPHQPSFMFNNGVTVEAWFNTMNSDDFASIVDKFDQTGSTTGFQVGFQGLESGGARGNLRVDLGYGSFYSTIRDTNFVMDGLWHHMAITCDGAVGKLYLDGLPTGNVVSNAYQLDNSAPVSIGKDSCCANRNFKGQIDDLSIYTRALSAEEIQAVFIADSAGKCMQVEPVQVLLQNPTATYSQSGFPVTSTSDSITNQSVNSWAINGSVGSHAAVWETQSDQGLSTGNQYIFTLFHTDPLPAPDHSIGRFRISYTRDDRAEFADMLITGGDVTANWTVLKLENAFSSSGETFTELEDNSLLVSGGSNFFPVYQVTARAHIAGITGFRLELLQHPSLPSNGPGRQPSNGNCHLSEFSVYSVPLTGVATNPPPNIQPAMTNVIVGASITFSVIQGKAPFLFDLEENQSGGSINGFSGVYVAGPLDGGTDVIRVTDALGRVSRASISVLPDPTPRPDLAVHSIQLPPSIQPGIPFELIWTVTNRGNATAFGPWVEQVFDSTDNVIGGDMFLGAFEIMDSLAAGEFRTRTQLVSLSVLGDAGPLHVVLSVDTDGAVYESDESNNTSMTPGTLTVPLVLTLAPQASSVAEGNSLIFSVTRNGFRTTPLEVNLLSLSPDELTTPSTITIPAGASMAFFTVNAITDGLFDGAQSAQLSAESPGFSGSVVTVEVTDSDIPSLMISLATNQVVEGGSVEVEILRELVTPDPLDISLNGGAGQLAYPGFVTIEPNTNRVTFTMITLGDTLVEPTKTLSFTAAAAGFQAAVGNLTVEDDDIPVVTLKLGNSIVSEGAGANATTATVTRDRNSPRALALLIESDDVTAVQLPERVTIAAGQTNTSFFINVLDNFQVNPTRPVILGGLILATLTDAPVRLIEPDTLMVTDDDGPALRMNLERDLVGEGLNPALTAMVFRNTGSNGSLTVDLSASDPTEALVPASVIIPDGSESVSFSITTLNDGVADGNQPVAIEAMTSGYAPAAATLIVSDADLPDLTITAITFPTNALTGEQLNVTYRIENQGIAPVDAQFTQRILLSSDAQAGDDTIAAQASFSGVIPVGLFFEQTLRVHMPQSPGNLWLVISTDANNQVNEGLENNNTKVTALPVSVVKAYSATVMANLETAPTGTSVLLSGQATRTFTGQPAAFEVVSVHLTLRGTRRVLSALTDANGNYAITFTPLPGEAGVYTVGADHPGIANPSLQDSFTLLGLRVPAQALLRTAEGGTVTNATLVENLSNIGLTGLNAMVLGGPTNLNLSIEFQTDSVPGDDVTGLNIILSAPTGVAGSGAFLVQIDSAEGASTQFEVPVQVDPLVPRLSAFPSSLTGGMSRGQQVSVSFGITNSGGSATGPLTVLLPALPWLSVSTGAQIPSLEPGQGSFITLLLTPPTDLPLGNHSGSLALNGTSVGLSVPFTFRALSDSTGTLQITAVDELTFYGENSPNLTNATIRLSDSNTGFTIIETNLAGQTELILTELPEAYYTLRLDAPDHSPYQDTFLLQPAQTNMVIAFLSRQSVQYTWTVMPVSVEDRYEIIVETTFETSVPLPVITVEPSAIDVTDFPGETKQVDLKITNHGLLAAQSTRLSFDVHPNLIITPLIDDIGELPAQSALTIPVIMRKAGLGGADGTGGGDGEEASCSIGGKLEWQIECAGQAITHTIPLKAFNLNKIGVECGTSAQNIFFVSGGLPPAGLNFAALSGGLNDPGYTAPIAFAEESVCDPCVQKVASGILEFCPPLLPIDIFESPDHEENCEQSDSSASQLVSCFQEAYDELTEIVNDPLDELSELSEDLGEAGEGLGSATGAIKDGLGAVKKGLDIASCLAPLFSDCLVDSGGNSGTGTGVGDGSGGGGSTSFPPVTAPLANRVEQVMTVLAGYTNLFGTDIWFQGNDTMAWTNWMQAFTARMNVATDSDALISTLERDELLSLPFPRPVITNDVNRLIDRWNRTVTYYESGIRNRLDVPSGQSLDFIDYDERQGVLERARAVHRSIQAEGFFDVAHAFNFTRQELLELLLGQSDGTCAKVRLRLEQQAVISRDAFKAMLEIDNNTATPLEEIGVAILVTDEDGNDRTDLFQIRPPSLEGLSSVDGLGILPAQSTGSSGWLLIPATQAAPTNETRYFVSGILSYQQDGTSLSIPLAPTPIDVLPNPLLVVDYFHERTVFSDDPFTPEIEPAIPYSLAVRVQNTGFGVAQSFHMESAQPEIVENEKGLLINFEIIATEVSGVELIPALTADFGDINPGTSVVGRWLFRSSLQGLFTDYSATFQHVSGLGDERFSLIDTVNIHEMIHLVQADGDFEDGLPDFLANDLPDLEDLPDTLHFSEGGNMSVNVLTEAAFDGTVSPGNLTVQMTSTPSTGWIYLRVPDPADSGFVLRRVQRMDGSMIAVSTNAWRTDRTFIGFGQRPVRENILHLLDFNSGGEYTLVYEGTSQMADIMAPVSSVNPLPSANTATFNVTWSGMDELDGSGIAFFDIFVSADGEPFTNWLERTTMGGAVYEVQTGRNYAFYSRATDAAGNQEPPHLFADTETSITLINSAPTLSLGPDLEVNEGSTVMISAMGVDTDIPAQTLTYTLLPGGPAGVTLDPGTGVLRLLTGEGQGPSTNLITARVMDSGFPALSATSSVTLVVREVNQAPLLSSIEDITIAEGSNLVIPANAVDLDLPMNSLVYMLGDGAPAGAGILPLSGTFQWRPTVTQGPSSNWISVIVTDNGIPSLSATQSFAVIVPDTRRDFTLSAGSTNMFVGESNLVALQLNSGVTLSEVSFELNVTDPLLGNFSLDSFGPEVISATLAPVNKNQSLLQFTLSESFALEREHKLAHLGFVAGNTGTSARVFLMLENPIGTQPNLDLITEADLVHGRVIVINQKAILEIDGDSDLPITLFGRPDQAYQLEHTTSLTPPVVWQLGTNLVLPGRYLRLPLPEGNSPAQFYRMVSP